MFSSEADGKGSGRARPVLLFLRQIDSLAPSVCMGCATTMALGVRWLACGASHHGWPPGISPAGAGGGGASGVSGLQTMARKP
jgi:hypothetical protein